MTVAVVLLDIHGGDLVSEPIDFIIDTGASRTALHPADAVKRVGLEASRLADPRLWNRVEEIRGVGGTDLGFVVQCRYVLLNEDDSAVIIDSSIRIARLQPFNETYPSLLSRDVLQHFEFVFAPARDEVLLNYLS